MFKYLDMIKNRDPAATSKLEIFFCYPGVHILIFYKIARKLWDMKLNFPARFIMHIGRILTGTDIHPGAKIGKRLVIDHGMGIVIGETAIIGDDVTLFHEVTLGGTTWDSIKRHPTIEDKVIIGAGAKVLGNITIGKECRIGSNSVVLKSTKPNSTIVGIPGVEIINANKATSGDKINLNHHLIPDPVAEIIKELEKRIGVLENK